ncbi:MAG: cell division protein FtsL [Betaproteobacteria bacterium]|nr:cell division protein FtsL [Betaproteobacteria bacterium]
MTRIDIFLVLLITVSALAVVTARHEARKLFLDLQQVQKTGRDLEVEWERLLLKQASWAMYHKVEAIATQRLGMNHPDASHIRVLAAETELNSGAVNASGTGSSGPKVGR